MRTSGSLSIVGRMAFQRMRLVGAVFCTGAVALGCGGAESGDDGPPVTVPTDTSVQGIAAFLDGERYKQTGWQSETAEPRDSDPSHGEQVHLWMNETAITGQEDDPDNLPVDSMAVKELYAGGDRVGVAALLKTDEGSTSEAWLFFCHGPAGRCSHAEPEHPVDDPLYGRGLAVDCGFCHAGIITEFPR